MTSAVSVRNLTKTYDGRRVLDGIDFDLEPGHILAIMGSSGGGKTTLLRCIAGLIPFEAGKILVEGIDVQRDVEAARHAMGMVFQSAALFDYLNVRDNVLFGVRRWMHPSRDEEEAILEEILARVGLQGSADLMPSELSGGMRKRVGLARALAVKPRVMLYDEPTTGLDPITTYAIDRLITSVRDDLGVTSLVVSHDVTSVFRTADQVAFLHAGQLVFLGSIADFQASENPAIREMLDRSAVG